MIFIHDFLTPVEVQVLKRLAAHQVGWEEGRQGTGYRKLDLKRVSCIADIGQRALYNIGKPHENYWDMVLLHYPDGSYIPPHRDEASIYGLRHRRLNAMVTEPLAGGVLKVEGQEVRLMAGEAIIFHPDELTHEVSQVSGERLLFSVGAWI